MYSEMWKLSIYKIPCFSLQLNTFLCLN